MVRRLAYSCNFGYLPRLPAPPPRDIPPPPRPDGLLGLLDGRDADGLLVGRLVGLDGRDDVGLLLEDGLEDGLPEGIPGPPWCGGR